MPKEVSYGNGYRFTASYTARMQALRAELTSPAALVVMGAENQYYPDGRLMFSSDLRPSSDHNFDRRFRYDHVGRLKLALSGAEARGEANIDRKVVPLMQSYDYNELTT